MVENNGVGFDAVERKADGRLERKDRNQEQREVGKPRLRKMWTMRSILMLSKKPWMSKRTTDAVEPARTAA